MIPAGADEPEGLLAFMNVVQVARVVTEHLDARLGQELGISAPLNEMLLRLAMEPDAQLPMVDLAGLLMVSKSGMTRIVDRAVEAGWVERVPSAQDRRVTYARLTRAGYEMVARSRLVWAEAVGEAFSRHLAGGDEDAVRAAMRRVLEGNGAWEEERCSPDLTQTAAGA